MTDIPHLIAANEARWQSCHVTASRLGEANRVASRLTALNAKSIYRAIELDTTVPWWVIAVIHERESGQDWNANIAQGDPWNRVSWHVPKGRGPFHSFHDAAVDALTKCAPFAAKWKNWTAGGSLTLLELYNGLGYENYHHEASPYIWGATNQEQWGKYIADGVWSHVVWDTQLGAAAMLKQMIAIDQSIQFQEPAVA